MSFEFNGEEFVEQQILPDRRECTLKIIKADEKVYDVKDRDSKEPTGEQGNFLKLTCSIRDAGADILNPAPIFHAMFAPTSQDTPQSKNRKLQDLKDLCVAVGWNWEDCKNGFDSDNLIGKTCVAVCEPRARRDDETIMENAIVFFKKPAF